MEYSLLLGAVGTCALGGFLPWISAEVVVVGAAFALPPGQLPALVLLCATAQVSAKLVVYELARWAPQRLPKRGQALLAKTERFGERRVLLGVMSFTGALVSLPPFYLITLAAGTLKSPMAVFGIAAFLGTVGRYGALVWAAVRAGAGA